jgi:hypothetical protein
MFKAWDKKMGSTINLNNNGKYKTCWSYKVLRHHTRKKSNLETRFHCSLGHFVRQFFFFWLKVETEFFFVFWLNLLGGGRRTFASMNVEVFVNFILLYFELWIRNVSLKSLFNTIENFKTEKWLYNLKSMLTST